MPKEHESIGAVGPRDDAPSPLALLSIIFLIAAAIAALFASAMPGVQRKLDRDHALFCEVYGPAWRRGDLTTEQIYRYRKTCEETHAD